MFPAEPAGRETFAPSTPEATTASVALAVIVTLGGVSVVCLARIKLTGLTAIFVSSVISVDLYEPNSKSLPAPTCHTCPFVSPIVKSPASEEVVCLCPPSSDQAQTRAVVPVPSSSLVVPETVRVSEITSFSITKERFLFSLTPRTTFSSSVDTAL